MTLTLALKASFLSRQRVFRQVAGGQAESVILRQKLRTSIRSSRHKRNSRHRVWPVLHLSGKRARVAVPRQTMTESRVEHTRFGNVAPFLRVEGRCLRVDSSVATCHDRLGSPTEYGSAGMIKTKSDQIITVEVV